ncbi:hypothetical protein SUGI_0658600 [Cryptomeria japonica]|uniref:uncharacterized protein LOC131068671 isoform X2 n=1 Tax=Cryptomeria japonica TaxID=3369 RepID=UPI002414AD8F|nr:uncharacterized protein LOC131068671 isoform X2 [Cryptomeria japonica]GLJ32727.1 hypothetical protein SUGI_0658600 [Cryptomeria japonica]
MRIRKHSIAVSSASNGRSTEKDEKEEEEERKRKEFLLPLVAAVATAEGEITVKPPHNWKNALVTCTSHSEAAQVVREVQKANHRWNEIMSTNRLKKRSVLPSEGISVKKHKASSKISKLYAKQDLTKSGQFELEKTSMRRGREHNLREKEKRDDEHSTIVSVDHGRKDDSYGGTRESTHKYKNRRKTNSTKNNNDKDVGSQCRRRNGRGWRCSERTLVGYSLCEHHRGKGRFKSLNGSNGADKVSVNNKSNKFKELSFIQGDVSCKVEFP